MDFCWYFVRTRHNFRFINSGSAAVIVVKLDTQLPCSLSSAHRIQISNPLSVKYLDSMVDGITPIKGIQLKHCKQN